MIVFLISLKRSGILGGIQPLIDMINLQETFDSETAAHTFRKDTSKWNLRIQHIALSKLALRGNALNSETADGSAWVASEYQGCQVSRVRSIASS